MAEWSKAAVLKTALRESVAGVRIPPHPFTTLYTTARFRITLQNKGFRISLRRSAGRFCGVLHRFLQRFLSRLRGAFQGLVKVCGKHPQVVFERHLWAIAQPGSHRLRTV